MTKCKIYGENILYKNGRWEHHYRYPHIAIPEDQTVDPFMHQITFKK